MSIDRVHGLRHFGQSFFDVVFGNPRFGALNISP
jgi:hypothetical protein